MILQGYLDVVGGYEREIGVVVEPGGEVEADVFGGGDGGGGWVAAEEDGFSAGGAEGGGGAGGDPAGGAVFVEGGGVDVGFDCVVE